MSTKRSKYPPEYYPGAVVCDAWGRMHRSVAARHNGALIYRMPDLDVPPQDQESDPDLRDENRHRFLRLLASTALFTTIELRTLYALLIDRCSLKEIAERDGCSRQAVVARVIGNSMGHGGIIRKMRDLTETDPFLAWAPELLELA